MLSVCAFQQSICWCIAILFIRQVRAGPVDALPLLLLRLAACLQNIQRRGAVAMRKSCVAVAHDVLSKSLTPAPARHAETCLDPRHTSCISCMPEVLLKW